MVRGRICAEPGDEASGRGRVCVQVTESRGGIALSRCIGSRELGLPGGRTTVVGGSLGDV